MKRFSRKANPGWYDHPTIEGLEKYWNGKFWSKSVRKAGDISVVAIEPDKKYLGRFLQEGLGQRLFVHLFDLPGLAFVVIPLGAIGILLSAYFGLYFLLLYFASIMKVILLLFVVFVGVGIVWFGIKNPKSFLDSLAYSLGWIFMILFWLGMYLLLMSLSPSEGGGCIKWGLDFCNY